jgi:hypothetical protein
MGEFDPTTFEVLAIDEFKRKRWDRNITDEGLLADLALLAMASHENEDDDED